ncbi:MAG: STAS domain-containing protein [Alcanivorax sp.]|nr:STAS domain-containing protein [Alcanivorax sp.]
MEGRTVYLSGALDFDSVLSVDHRLTAWLQQQRDDCTVDLRDVGYSNSAGIALLLGWLRLARQRSITLHWQNLTPDLLAMARVGGLQSLFEKTSGDN